MRMAKINSDTPEFICLSAQILIMSAKCQVGCYRIQRYFSSSCRVGNVLLAAQYILNMTHPLLRFVCRHRYTIA